MQEELRRLIVETARSIGADPVDLATAISFETGGSFDPLQIGPTTKHGQHRGLIQFGEPQARQFGVDWDDPLNSQLGADKAVAKYFKASGFKPGMSGLDLYSTINAGAPGLYNASDTAAGGTAGNVRDKWEKQMGEHRKKAEALILNPNERLGGDSMVPRSHYAEIAGQMSTPLFGTSDSLFGPARPPSGVPRDVAEYAFGESPGGRIGKALQGIAGAFKAPPPPSTSGGGDARASGDALLKLLGNPDQIADMLLGRRNPFA